MSASESDAYAFDAGSGDPSLGLRIRNLSHWFIQGQQAQLVLDDLSLDVPHNQFIALIGSSGCGKTTLLNLVAGLEQPRLGTIEAQSDTGSMTMSAGHLGYMFARDALFPWRTLIRNVEYPLEVRRVDKSERRERAIAAIRLVGLAGSERKYPAQMSQGMRQRANLARLIASEPAFYLMDEPFSALDAETKGVLQQEFLSIWQLRPRTVLFVTHDISEAALLADRVLIMSGGHIAADIEVPFGRPRDLDELRFDPHHVEFDHDLRAQFAQWSTLIRSESEGGSP